MKTLIYKEFKLAWHPLCYIFPILFSLLILIPSYPPWVGMMLTGITYTILFIGANKGKQTNDLYYTVNLPVKKSHIVISRFISMAIMQLISIAITVAFVPLAYLIFKSTGSTKQVGFNYDTLAVCIAFGIIGYIIVDAFYLLMYYKKGRSVILPSLLGMFVFMLFMLALTTLLPTFIPSFMNFFKPVWIQAVSVVISLVVYGLCHIFILKGAIKRINKINF